MTLRQIDDTIARCTMFRQYTFSLEWSPERHYVPGTQIELRAASLMAFYCWRWVRMLVEGAEVTFAWKRDPSPTEIWRNRDHVILRASLRYGIRHGDRLRLKLTVTPPIWAGCDVSLSIWIVDPPSGFDPDATPSEPHKEDASDCVIPVVAGPVERFAVYSRPMPGRDGKVRVCLVPEDRFANPSALTSPTRVRLEWEGRAWTVDVQEPVVISVPPPADIGRLKALIPMQSLSPLETIRNGIQEGDDLVVTGNPVWREGPDGLQATFGAIHWHTELSSDGIRPIEEALRSARDYLNLDFVAPGDHYTRGERWDRTVHALEAFDAPDDFATLFGWEDGGLEGHENYLFTDPAHPLVCGGEAGFTGEASAVRRDLILGKHKGFVAIPHHTNSPAMIRRADNDAPVWHPYSWGKPREYRRLVEIMQLRGGQERDDGAADAWRGWQQNNRASAQDALAMGHKLGFVGGSDNHGGWPGRAFDEVQGPGKHPPASVILTGLWTPRVERQEVFMALWERHTFAVWDTRALVWFAVNCSMSGDELVVKSGDELHAQIRLSAQSALQSVEIISGGRTIWVSSFSQLDIDITVPLGQLEQSTCFYLRALQRDGGIIYSSPVFVVVE